MRAMCVVLILSILHLSLGCYNTKMVCEDIDIREYLQEEMGVYYLSTNDSVEYDFALHQHIYEFKNDSLYGRAKRFPAEIRQKFEDVKFAVTDINCLETRQYDSRRTYIAYICLTIGFWIFFISTLPDYDKNREYY